MVKAGVTTKRYRAALTMEDGKRTTKRFDTEQEAEDWLALKRAEMGLGTFIAPSEVKFGTYIAEWLVTHVEPDVRERTMDRYISLLAHMSTITEKPVQQITATMLKKLYNGITVKRVHKDSKTKKSTLSYSILLRAGQNRPDHSDQPRQRCCST